LLRTAIVLTRPASHKTWLRHWTPSLDIWPHT